MVSWQEWALIVVIVVILFGATAIPKVARALGRAQGEFKKAKKQFDEEAAKAEVESSEEEVRRTARDLGIDDKGKDIAELKRLIQEKA